MLPNAALKHFVIKCADFQAVYVPDASKLALRALAETLARALFPSDAAPGLCLLPDKLHDWALARAPRGHAEAVQRRVAALVALLIVPTVGATVPAGADPAVASLGVLSGCGWLRSSLRALWSCSLLVF